MAMLKHAPETDLAIVDGSPGIGCPVISSVSGMDLVLVVAEPSRSGLSDLERLVKTAETFQTKLAVCVNKWDVSPEYTRAIQEFCVEKGNPFAGTVPYDHHASEAINQGKSLADIDCPAGGRCKKSLQSSPHCWLNALSKRKGQRRQPVRGSHMPYKIYQTIRENHLMKIAVSCNGNTECRPFRSL